MGRGDRRGVTLMETVVSVAVLVLLGLVMLPMVDSARLQMRSTVSEKNLRALGVGSGLYARDHGGRIFGFNWLPGESYTLPDGSVRTASSDVEAATNQEREILMRLSGRVTGQFKILNYSATLPHRRMSHLVLLDYMNEPLGSSLFIDPSDINQQFWSLFPQDYGPGSFVPYANGPPPPGYYQSFVLESTAARQRWAYGSSYQVVTSAWNPDSPAPRYVPVSSSPHSYAGTGGIELASGRNRSEVRYPSSKVWMFEEFDRERSGSPYFAFGSARVAKLMFDGSVNTFVTTDASQSSVPEYGSGPWNQTYVPFDLFPVPLNGLGNSPSLNMRWMWTTRGLGGLDYPPLMAPRGPRVKGFGP